jgi:hypothetical protein
VSIDFLFEIERAVERGKEIYACPGVVSGRWEIGSSIETIRKAAKRSAESRKTSVNIMRLVPNTSLMPDTPLLIATKIGDGDGASAITWTTVDTKDAAETLRDVSQGPSPYFGLEVEETVQPA